MVLLQKKEHTFIIGSYNPFYPDYELTSQATYFECVNFNHFLPSEFLPENYFFIFHFDGFMARTLPYIYLYLMHIRHGTEKLVIYSCSSHTRQKLLIRKIPV